MNKLLRASYSNDDIKQTIFNMGPTKVPTPDGFHVLFYQRYWSLVGRQVIVLYPSVLNRKISIGLLNKTNIVLIPKILVPCKVIDFRPFGLCNATYKMITNDGPLSPIPPVDPSDISQKLSSCDLLRLESSREAKLYSFT